MNCQNCRAEVSPGNAFCTACGAALKTPAAPPPQTDPGPVMASELPHESGCRGKPMGRAGCLLIVLALIVGAGLFGFRGLISDFITDLRTDYSKDSRTLNKLDKDVDQAAFQRAIDYLDANVPEIKQQQALYHQKKNTGIEVGYTLQGVELPPPAAPDYELVENYHWVYVSFWFHKGLFDDKQLWSWTFLVKKDFSEMLGYDNENDTFVKIDQWRKDIDRERKYMSLADENDRK